MDLEVLCSFADCFEKTAAGQDVWDFGVLRGPDKRLYRDQVHWGEEGETPQAVMQRLSPEDTEEAIAEHRKAHGEIGAVGGGSVGALLGIGGGATADAVMAAPRVKPDARMLSRAFARARFPLAMAGGGAVGALGLGALGYLLGKHTPVPKMTKREWRGAEIRG